MPDAQNTARTPASVMAETCPQCTHEAFWHGGSADPIGGCLVYGCDCGWPKEALR